MTTTFAEIPAASIREADGALLLTADDGTQVALTGDHWRLRQALLDAAYTVPITGDDRAGLEAIVWEAIVGAIDWATLGVDPAQIAAIEVPQTEEWDNGWFPSHSVTAFDADGTELVQVSDYDGDGDSTVVGDALGDVLDEMQELEGPFVRFWSLKVLRPQVN